MMGDLFFPFLEDIVSKDGLILKNYIILGSLDHHISGFLLSTQNVSSVRLVVCVC